MLNTHRETNIAEVAVKRHPPGASYEDASGAVVVGADVSVQNEPTGIEYSTKSDSAGIYQIASLAVGRYKVQVKASRLQTQVVKGLV